MEIRTTGDNAYEAACTVVIVVPEKALTSAGHIRTLTADQSSERKHEFHALAQTALVQFEDRDLEPITVDGESG